MKILDIMYNIFPYILILMLVCVRAWYEENRYKNLCKVIDVLNDRCKMLENKVLKGDKK